MSYLLDNAMKISYNNFHSVIITEINMLYMKAQEIIKIQKKEHLKCNQFYSILNH